MPPAALSRNECPKHVRAESGLTPASPRAPGRAVRASARLLAGAGCALLALGAPAARANPFELYGFTPRATALGGASVALGDDLGASFYNPAGLLGHTKTEFGIGFADTVSDLHIDRSSTTSTVPNGFVDAAPRFELGLIFPLGGAILKDRVVIGISGGHPLGSLVRVQTIDQSRPQFYMYQSKPQRFALAGSIGIKIIDGLSIGGGVQITAQQIGTVHFALDVAARRFTAREITVDLKTVPTGIAGILIQPANWLNIGLSWRQESSLYFEQPTDIDLGDIGDLKLGVNGIAQYWPHVFSGGFTVKPTSKLLVSAQVDYLLWHRAPQDQVQVTITPSGPVLDGLGLSSVLGFGSQDAHPQFANIFIPRLGVEYAAREWLTVRGGAWLRPAVTPDQIGTTNYLDNFTESVSAGVTFRFKDPLEVFSDPVAFDVAGAFMHANERVSQKTQQLDPTGSYSFGGNLVTMSAMLRYLY